MYHAIITRNINMLLLQLKTSFKPAYKITQISSASLLNDLTPYKGQQLATIWE